MSEAPETPDVGNFSKPDIAANAIYPLAARAALYELHAKLLELLESSLSSRKTGRNILVVGPGSDVLPYSEHLDSVSRLLNGGNLILLDYNPEICVGIPAYLDSKGFTQHFHVELFQGDELIDPDTYRDTILIRHWNVRNGFPVTTASLDAIDMTLSMHHVTQYESDIAALFTYLAGVLKPTGLLHLGEGAVDMKYSERKIEKLARDVLESGARGVRISDARYADAPDRQWQVGDENADVSIHISMDGMVGIRSADIEKIASHLEKSGYKQIYLGEQIIVLPLIDHSMEEDFSQMIAPISAYYDAITQVALPHLDPAYHEPFIQALTKEQSDAVRGIVEYYSSPSVLCEALVKSGFQVDKVHNTPSGPFVNILAIRP